MNNRKKIAVNTRFLIKNKLEGIGLFTYESLKLIVNAHPETDFYFLFDRPYSTEFIFAENVKPVVLIPQARHPFLWYWWFELSVARWLNKNQPDLFLSTDGYGCLNTSVKQVLVIHDLAYEHYADHVTALVYRYYKYFMPRFAKKATRIATVSEYSRQDIVKLYGINPDKIDVVYNGAKDVYRPLNADTILATRQKYTAGKPYFIYVGSIHPRKNIKNLLLAFEAFKTGTQSDFKLVLAGRKAWDYQEVEVVYNALLHKNDVIFTGHIPPEELAAITGAAHAMVYVSLFEGFGIPVIEAMSSHVPVITSNVTSMPEAAGDAALLVNPGSVTEISSAMQKIASDDTLRSLLIEKGSVQLKKFSWALTAQKLWQCCEKALLNQ